MRLFHVWLHRPEVTEPRRRARGGPGRTVPGPGQATQERGASRHRRRPLPRGSRMDVLKKSTALAAALLCATTKPQIPELRPGRIALGAASLDLSYSGIVPMADRDRVLEIS